MHLLDLRGFEDAKMEIGRPKGEKADWLIGCDPITLINRQSALDLLFEIIIQKSLLLFSNLQFQFCILIFKSEFLHQGTIQGFAYLLILLNC
ncbi:hypothetical protein L1987_32217 [Smallanthus sonchifolius]|uniref:Uncharacterized protein n=1 Tax=Smallanthus sonchifolius TaxID=185202 RepID=A0ACB9I7U9_9ASTR|nr:hypothetical protein L1987_32217 [Smallanthus sonchifolius]